ncbi:hypothetical protein DRE_00746 [Drechslerella stenobrocha 248]|uniref:Uncharacterized protein n=1 Tax=Drechslerella stenobrocha 248 TaxID=1043628 RepID=W7HYS9_9PEZI|nr:hypothetical protein DRE_00746 [Drechslerella stenobrocha 248]
MSRSGSHSPVQSQLDGQADNGPPHEDQQQQQQQQQPQQQCSYSTAPYSWREAELATAPGRGRGRYDSKTAYILWQAHLYCADYDDIHELYATRYGGNEENEKTVRRAILKDVKGMIGPAAKERMAGTVFQKYLAWVREESQSYCHARDKPRIGRTPRQHERYEALNEHDRRLGRAERATYLDIQYSEERSVALKDTNNACKNPERLKTAIAKCDAELNRLLHRQGVLREATRDVLLKRGREKKAVEWMKRQGWRGNFLVEEQEEEEAGEGEGGEVEKGIQAAMKGIGALVLGFVDSEDDTEEEEAAVVVEEGLVAVDDGSGFW